MVNDEVVYELHSVFVTSLEHLLPVFHSTIRLVQCPVMTVTVSSRVVLILSEDALVVTNIVSLYSATVPQ